MQTQGTAKVSTLSIRLREALNIRDMKAIDLANKANVNRGMISRYMSDTSQPKAVVINKLAVALNVDEMWLWGFDVPMERRNKYVRDLQELLDYKIKTTPIFYEILEKIAHLSKSRHDELLNFIEYMRYKDRVDLDDVDTDEAEDGEKGDARDGEKGGDNFSAR